MPEPQPPPILEYQPRAEADPYRTKFDWQTYPLASGALYAVETGVWAGFWIFGFPFATATIAHNVSALVAVLPWSVAHAWAVFPLLRRARKHGRPIWLEMSCLAVTGGSLLITLLAIVLRTVGLDFFPAR